MAGNDSAQTRVARLLHSASKVLDTVDPNPVIGDVVASSVEDTRTDEDARGVTPAFAENTPDALSLYLRPGGAGATVRDTVDTSILAARRVVSDHLGLEACKWLDARLEPARARDYRANRNGGVFGSTFDRYGVAESVVGFDFTDRIWDALVPALHRLARTVVSALPGLRPSFTMVRCGRSAGSQQITFDVDAPLALLELKPLMTELGLGHHHGSLMSATAFLLGARFTLPRRAAQLTFRPVRGGVEMRIDVRLEAIEDPPPQMLSLLRLVMAERPRSLRTLERWLGAFTAEGFPDAGDFTVLTVWVRHDTPARVALFLRPAVLEHEHRHHRHHHEGNGDRPRVEAISPWDSYA
jgi:hypothetical protein